MKLHIIMLYLQGVPKNPSEIQKEIGTKIFRIGREIAVINELEVGNPPF